MISEVQPPGLFPYPSCDLFPGFSPQLGGAWRLPSVVSGLDRLESVLKV